MFKHAMTLLSVFLLSAPSVAAEPGVSDALKLMEGTWSGALIYRDYQSDKRVSIPHDRVIHVGPNGGYALHQNTFTDPGYQVFSAQLFRVNASTLVVASTTGSSIETETFSISAAEMIGAEWAITAYGEGEDNDRPATIRLQVKLSKTALEIERQIKPEGQTEFQFRNAISLQRQEQTP